MSSELKVHGAREITFHGDVICDISDSIDMTEWDERHVHLQLYSIDEGGFVGAIELSSSNFMIPAIREAEELDTVNEIAKFFSVFDPSEHVTEGRGRNATSSTTLSRHLLGQLYERLVDQALGAVADFHQRNPDCERKIVPAPREVNRVLKFLGLA